MKRSNLVAPHNIEIEKALIGAMLIENEWIDAVAPFVRDVDFYLEKHRKIYGRIVAMYRETGAADMFLVWQSFKDDGQDAEVGGLAYISSITDVVPMSSNSVRYAQEIARIARQREMVSVLTDLVSEVHSGERGVDEAAAFIQAKALERRPKEQQPTMVELLKDVLSGFEDEFEGKAIPCLHTPWSGLTRLCPMWWEDNIIVAARPAMGKTAFALSLASDWAEHHGHPVDFFSCEMSSKKLLRRIVAQKARVNLRKIRDWDEDDWRRVARAMEKIANWNIRFFDRGGWTIEEIADIVEARQKVVGRYAVFVDYLQLLSATNVRSNGNEKVTHISTQWKNLLRRTGCIGVMLSQLNRSLESREDKRPIPSDLRESGSIEQDADMIIALYREAVYELRRYKANNIAINGRVPMNEEELPFELRRNAEAIVLKAREGVMGTVPMDWEGAHMLYTEAKRGFVEE